MGTFYCLNKPKNKKIRFLLPRTAILKNSNEIREVLQEGIKLSGKSINIFFKTADVNNFAVVTPKRIGHAVKRNRMKRLAREIYRKNPAWFNGSKVVFFIKRFNNSYALMEKEIAQLVARK